ncbi:MAG TPA: hypothetical protein VM737_05665 [Gemmatimonadota bacterium]|nr:hypothetical protein [Gemmatimonadota bacterium]
MSLYQASILLHVAAAFLWLGHMFFWSVFGGPALKAIDPPETASRLRAMSLKMGGLGWPALMILVATGITMLAARGIGVGDLLSRDFLAAPFGKALAGKLCLVAAMVGFQIGFGHRPAPRAIYLNMLAALLVLGASVFLSRS